LVNLSLYSVERFLLAFTSSFQIVVFGLVQSQIIALIALAMALPAIIWMQIHRLQATPGEIMPSSMGREGGAQ